MQAKLLALVFVISFLCSCQKEIAADIVARQDSASGHLTGLLKRMYGPNGRAGTASIDSFEYDSRKRLVKLSSWRTDSFSLPFRKYDEQTVIFYYNGSNDFPEKNISAFHPDLFPVQTDTVLYFYNGQNRLFKDEFTGNWNVNAGAKVTHEYTYSNNNIFLKSYYQPDITNSFRELHFLDSLFYDGTNLTTSKHSSYAGWDSVYAVNYTYDNKANPFYDINVYKYVGGTSSYGYGSDALLLRTKNNIISRTNYTKYTMPGTPTYTSVFTYNTGLYPVRELFTDHANPVFNDTTYYDYY